MDRLRWDNIARAGAVLALVALVVAWPHLRGKAPSLPSAAATPVSIEDPARPPATTQAPPPRAPRAARPAKRRHPAPRKVRRHRAVRVKRPALAAPPASPVTAPAPRPAPVRRPIPTASDQAAREFAVP